MHVHLHVHERSDGGIAREERMLQPPVQGLSDYGRGGDAREGRHVRNAREGRAAREKLPTRRVINAVTERYGRMIVRQNEPVVLQGRLRRPADRSVVTDDDREQHLREHAHGLKSGTVQRLW